MSIVISVIILILSMLISFCLQLTPGTFALFYHYALGKTNAKKADDQSLSFILGVEIFITAIWLLIYFSIFLFFYYNFNFSNIVFYIMAGVFFAEAIIMPFLYYRKGNSTALFIPRRIAKGILNRIAKIRNRSDCILLGALTGLFELIFTLPLYIISASILLNFDALPRVLTIALYLTLSVLPLFIIRCSFRLGHNLADIERFRVKIKPAIKITLCTSFLLLALATIYLGVLNNG